MFWFKTVLLSGLSFSCASLLAQDATGQLPQTETPSNTSEPIGTYITDTSSSAVRSGQNVSVGLRTGLFVYTFPGIGLESNFIMNKSLQFGGHVGIGQLDLKNAVDEESTVSVEKAMIKAFSAGAHARWFVLNSFYLTSGLQYRTIGTNIRVEDSLDSSIFIETKTTSDSFCLDLGLGNLWSFGSGFYIGAEWFGASIPFSSTFDSEVTSGGLLTTDLQETADSNEDLAEDMSKAVTYRIAVLQIGWAF